MSEKENNSEDDCLPSCQSSDAEPDSEENEKNGEILEEEDIERIDSEPTKARGRGRPKKKNSPSVASKKSDEPKKGRGRPPKSAKGRGRPPKEKNSEAETSPDSKKTSLSPAPKSKKVEQTDDDGSENENKSSPIATTKGRGRPKKTENASSKSDNVEESDESSSSPPVSKGRGRPKKVENTSPASKVSSSSPPKGRGRPPKPQKGSVSSETTSSKGRGRPPKNRSISSSSSRGRGRPPKVQSEKKAQNEVSKTPVGSEEESDDELLSEDLEVSDDPAGADISDDPTVGDASEEEIEEKSTGKDDASEEEIEEESTGKDDASEKEIEEESTGIQQKRMLFANVLAVNKMKREEFEAKHRKRGRGRPRKCTNESSDQIESVIVEEIILPKDKAMTRAAAKVKKEIVPERVEPVEEEPFEYELLEVVDEPELEDIPNIEFICPAQVAQDYLIELEKAGRCRPRKQSIPAQSSSTPKPNAFKMKSSLKMCNLTPIPQELSYVNIKEEPPLDAEVVNEPRKPSFSYLLRSPETSYADSSVARDEASDYLEESLTEEEVVVPKPKKIKTEKVVLEEKPRKAWNRKPKISMETPKVEPTSLETALEELLECQIENDDELNEKLSKALETSRMEGKQKENRLSSLTKALENRRGEIEKEIELNRPRGRGRPKGSKRLKSTETYVTVLTADDDFQDERLVNVQTSKGAIRKARKVSEKTEVKPSIIPHSPPKILQKKDRRKSSIVPVQEAASETPKIVSGSLSEMLELRAKQNKNRMRREPSPQESEKLCEDEFVEMILMDFDD